MSQTTSTGAKKIEGTDDWRGIFDIHNDTVDAYDGQVSSLNQAIANNVQIPQKKITSTVASTIDSISKFNSVLADAGLYYIETNAAIRSTLIQLGLYPIDLSGNFEARKIASNYFFLHFKSYTNREWIATIDNGTVSAWQELAQKSDIAKDEGTLTSTNGTFTLQLLKRCGDVVTLTFKLTLSSTVAAWNEILNVPVGFRPSANINAFVALQQGSTTKVDQLQVLTDGALRLGSAVSSGEVLSLAVTYIK